MEQNKEGGRIGVIVVTGIPGVGKTTVMKKAAEGMDIPGTEELKEMLLDVVADKTGYPKEILDRKSVVEGEIGEDASKRIKIFKAVKNESHWVPEVNSAEMENIL